MLQAQFIWTASFLDSERNNAMSDLTKKAIEYHRKGYNCAQATACVFAERLGMDEKDVFRMMEGFGFGMGTMGTCGAVSAMAAVIGMKESDGDLDSPATKRICYKKMKELTGRFADANGSVICREIKGVDTGKVLRSCDGCIEDAVALLEEYLDGEQEETGEQQ